MVNWEYQYRTPFCMHNKLKKHITYNASIYFQVDNYGNSKSESPGVLRLHSQSLMLLPQITGLTQVTQTWDFHLRSNIYLIQQTYTELSCTVLGVAPIRDTYPTQTMKLWLFQCCWWNTKYPFKNHWRRWAICKFPRWTAPSSVRQDPWAKR